VDPPEPELETTETKPEPEPNARALIHVDKTLVAPAALLRVVHAILPLYAVFIRLAQFALWRRRA